MAIILILILFCLSYFKVIVVKAFKKIIEIIEILEAIFKTEIKTRSKTRTEASNYPTTCSSTLPLVGLFVAWK